MKKQTTLSRILLLSCLLLILSAARAQYVPLPDATFGNWLSTNGYASCLTGNATSGWNLDTTCSVLHTNHTIVCRTTQIHDFTGLRYFKGLYYIDCSQDSLLTSLPVLPDSMTTLICSNCRMTSLPVLPAGLLSLSCQVNKLTSINPLPAKLNHFDCGTNLLTSSPALPNTIQYFSCASNNISALPTLPDFLTFLNCAFNHITSLPAIPAGAIVLFVGQNPLTALPAIPSHVQVLNSLNAQLTAVPPLPMSISVLVLSHNNISALPALPDSLTYFDVSYNPLLSCLPAMPRDTIQTFYITNTDIHCLTNNFIATNHDTNPQFMPICTTPCHVSSGIDDVNATLEISLYPNPNHGTFTLQTSNGQGREYRIYDILGTMIEQKTITSDTESIDMHEAGEGVYILELKGAQPIRFTIMR